MTDQPIIVTGCQRSGTTITAHIVGNAKQFIGLEDIRLFRWEGQLYYCGVRRDIKTNGEGRMELCKLEVTPDGVYETTRDRFEVDPHTPLEKNWMPILDMPFHFVRWCDPLQVMRVNPKEKSKQTVKKGIWGRSPNGKRPR